MKRFHIGRWLLVTVIVSIIAMIALPISLLLLAIPFALEEMLFGTAHLFNVLPYSWSWLIGTIGIIGWLTLPILGDNKKQVGLLAIGTYIGLPLVALTLAGMVGILVSPHLSEVIDTTPHLKTHLLSFDNEDMTVQALKYSPDGRFIAIETEVYENYDDIIYLTIIDAETHEEIAQLPESFHSIWSDDNRLWTLSPGHWNVYAEPFTENQQVALGYDSEHKLPFGYNAWDFAPDSQTLVVTESNGDKSPIRRLSVWKQSHFAYTIEFEPKYEGLLGGQRSVELSLSPDGNYALVTVSGWVGYESPGPEELWLVDINKRTAKLVYEGKTKGWMIWDYSVQDLTPVWFQNSEEVLLADPEFGIESFNIHTGKSRRLLGWNNAGYDVILSKTNEELAFTYWPFKKNEKHLGVLSLDKRELIYLPEEYFDWPYIWYDWHPTERILTFITGDCYQYRISQWTVLPSEEIR